MSQRSFLTPPWVTFNLRQFAAEARHWYRLLVGSVVQAVFLHLAPEGAPIQAQDTADLRPISMIPEEVLQDRPFGRSHGLFEIRGS